MDWQESVEIIYETKDANSESVVAESEQMHVNNSADDILQWFDEDDEASGASDNILDTIKLRIKEVKKFRTTRAFKAFADLTAVMQYVKLQNHYRSNSKCT